MGYGKYFAGVPVGGPVSVNGQRPRIVLVCAVACMFVLCNCNVSLGTPIAGDYELVTGDLDAVYLKRKSEGIPAVSPLSYVGWNNDYIAMADEETGLNGLAVIEVRRHRFLTKQELTYFRTHWPTNVRLAKASEAVRRF